MQAKRILNFYLFLLTISLGCLLLLIKLYGKYDHGFLIIVGLSYTLYFLYIKGYRAIKILFIIAMFFMSLIMILSGILGDTGTYAFLLLGLFYFFFGIHILTSKQLRAHFNKIRPRKEPLSRKRPVDSPTHYKTIKERLLANDHGEYPEVLDRVKATFIDGIVVFTLLFISAYLMNELKIKSDLIRGIIFFLILSYEPIFTSFTRTLGQKINNIRVVRNKKGDKSINLLYSYLRFCIKINLGILSLILIVFDSQKRALHDYIMGAKMIKTSNPVF